MGLNPHRDRLCVVQMSNGDGTADVIQIPQDHSDAPNLRALLANPKITKIFHFARFDLAALYNAFGVMPQPVYCTKIASRLSRTYTDRHGLKDLVREVLNIDLSKQQQSSDWGSSNLSEAQLAYADGSTPCWRARAAPNWRRPASTSCRPGPSSTSAAGRPRTFSRILETRAI
jgi:ribonuclease D